MRPYVPTDCPRRDSDIWAIYCRTCINQALDMSAKAALNEDPDVESMMDTYTQPARAAPARRARR